MTLRCSNCRSLNADNMPSCGNCGASLAQAERLKIKKPGCSWNGTGMNCPYCGQPMDEGVFEVSARERPRWIGGGGKEEIMGQGPSFREFEGYRCRSCNCMLVYC